MMKSKSPAMLRTSCIYGEGFRNFPVLLGGFAETEQIVDAVLFMLSEIAWFCCGSELFVDDYMRSDQF